MSCLATGTALECYSCTSLGLGDSHSNDDCRDLDKTTTKTEPCQIGAGQVGRCMVFSGSVTVDPPLFDPKTASGTIRSCAVFDEAEVPGNGCIDATEIPSGFLGGVFSVATLLGADQVVQGQSCYCSKNRCNESSSAGVRLDVNVLLLLVLAAMQVFLMRRV